MTTQICDYCGKEFSATGIKNHLRSCRKVKETAADITDPITSTLTWLLVGYLNFLRFFLPSTINFYSLLTMPLGIFVCLSIHYVLWCYTFGSCGYFWTFRNTLCNIYNWFELGVEMIKAMITSISIMDDVSPTSI